MYIDESGVEGFVSNPKKTSLDDSWFTTGGILVNSQSISEFERTHIYMMKKYFADNRINLPHDFRLHYHNLRQNTYPYNRLSNQQRLDLADDVFGAIRSIDCKLVSATINKSTHVAKYDSPVNVRAYTLLICLERFQYFLEEQNDDGIVIYERFNTRLRKKMGAEMAKLRRIPSFPHLTNLHKIKGNIANGDPVKEKILQFSDFFAYAPHIKLITGHRNESRWNEIKEKYYAIDGDWTRRGFVVL